MSRVVILGGGYAGLRAALTVAGASEHDFEITLVDRYDYHQLITRLPRVAGGSLPAARACIPFSRILPPGVRHLRANIEHVDLAQRTITTSGGTLEADYLVLAAGSFPVDLRIPGAREHTVILRSLPEAIRLHSRLHDALLSGSGVSIVIVGAGYTSIELAGELAEWSRRFGTTAGHVHLGVTIVAPDARLLPEGDERLGAIAQDVLSRKGVETLLSRPINAVEESRVVTGDRQMVEADAIVWAVTSQPPVDMYEGAAVDAASGRLVVDPYLRAQSFERVFVAGDTGLVYDYRDDRVLPATAQLAVQEGEVAGANIVADARNRPLRELRGRVLGEAISLGGSDSVALTGGVVLTGRAAAALKSASLARYLYSLGGAALAATYAAA